MRKSLTTAASIAALAIALTGCQGSTSGKAHAAATSTLTQAQENYARGVVSRCLPHTHSLKSFTACAVPASQRTSFESCLRTQGMHILHLHGLKTEAEHAVESCLASTEGKK